MTRAKVLVTGSAGHLGEALTRVPRGHDYETVGLDLLASPGTDVTGSVTERALVRDCLAGLGTDAPAVVRGLFPDLAAEYARRGWRMFPRIDRVYVNARARADLGWAPRYDFRSFLDRLKAGDDPRSPLAVGAKGCHARSTGVYTVR